MRRLITAVVVVIVICCLVSYFAIQGKSSLYVDIKSGKVRQIDSVGFIVIKTESKDTRFSRYFASELPAEWVLTRVKYWYRNIRVNVGINGLDQELEKLMDAIGSRQLEAKVREDVLQGIAASVRAGKKIYVMIDENRDIEIVDVDGVVVAKIQS